MPKSITSYFDPDLSSDFINQWALFLGVPVDDGLCRASAQIIATTHNLNTDIKGSINTLTKVGDQWQSMTQNTISALTITVETVGTVSIRHQEMSQGLDKLTEICTKLESGIQESQTLYRDCLKQNLELQNFYSSTLQLSQNLFNSIEILNSGSPMNEQVEDYLNSVEQLRIDLRKPFKELVENHLQMEKNLAGLTTQMSNFEQKAIQSLSNLSQHQSTNNKQLATLSRLNEKIGRTMEDSLSKILLPVLSVALAISLFFHVWNFSASAATTTNINAFGGKNYHGMALSIMDSDYRQENLNRIDQCRVKNKKIKSDILECYLKIESGQN
jgi:hypothetical protein